MMNLDQHISVESAHNIEEICGPLKNYLHIGHLLFQRSFLNTDCQQDGMLFLGNRPEVITHLATNNCWVDHLVDCDIIPPAGYYMAETFYTPEFLAELRRAFNLHHIIAKITYDIKAQTRDVYMFSLDTSNTQAVASYLNHREALDQFCYYFQSKAAPLIKRAAQANPIVGPMQEIQEKRSWDEVKTECAIPQGFLLDTALARYPIVGKNGAVYLTAKERECLKHISSGHAIKEVAQKLAISPRTVETHWKHVREKLGCFTKSEVLNFLKRYPASSRILLL